MKIILCQRLSLAVSVASAAAASPKATVSRAETEPLSFLGAESGLTYHLYENAALAGIPSVTGTTETAELSLAPTRQQDGTNDVCYLSGELVGTATIDTDGLYTFECHFSATSTGWVWIDGHQVCGDGHAYVPRDEIDNPLPIRTTHRKQDYPFRVHITSNDTTWCNRHGNISGGDGGEVVPSVKVNWKRDELPEANKQKEATTIETTVDASHKKIQSNEFQLMTHESGISFQPRLSPPEEQREELQRSLKQGWGYWLRTSILSIVKLPEGLVMELSLCQLSTGKCLDNAIPDDAGVIRVGLHAYDRSYVGYNITFQGLELSMECSVGGSNQDELQFLISPIFCDHPNCAGDFELHVTGRYAWFRPGTISEIDSGLSFATPGLGAVDLTTVFEYDSSSATNGAIDDRDVVPEISRHLKDDKDKAMKPALKIPLQYDPRSDSKQKVGFVSGFKKAPSLSKMERTIRSKQKAEEERINQKFGSKASVAEAIQASVMWTLMYNPVENGPLMPVSRWSNWDNAEKSGSATKDWNYIIFDWDNLFASLLAGLDNKDIAYSNLIQTVKGKTAEGFIPNWNTGGVKSQDRTEPPVGAKVLLELFRKYRDAWIVEALFDDLLDWNDWFIAKRVLQPRGLIGLGSYYKASTPDAQVRISCNTMQAARWESGLDNSPMYDGNLYDNSTHMMQLYDVGMSALVVQEAYSLAELADIIGKDPKVGAALRKRGDTMRDLISSDMWDPEKLAYANRFVAKDSFVNHVTPTSFYPMAIGAGSQDQSETMVESWLLNSSRFCLSPNGDFEGNDPEKCYWGLPSVSADDPTYMESRWVYWRGYTWGPMSQLVYWSLQNTEQVGITSGGNLRQSAVLTEVSNSIDRARKSLCGQMEALFLSQWTENRHVCENYSPYQNSSECSGTLFYHWGALNGLIGMVEDGFW